MLAQCPQRQRRGITLIEMMVTVALISLIAAISFPAVSSGLDSLRLRAAAESIVSTFNASLDRADRNQQPIEIRIDRATSRIGVLGLNTGLEKVIDLPQGIRVTGVLPALPQGETPTRSFVVMPQGAVPRFLIALTNARGASQTVSVDPVTGLASIGAVQFGVVQ